MLRNYINKIIFNKTILFFQKVIGGTTAVCVLLLDKKLYIAWVGDSLAMLVKRGKVEELVYPHRLSRYVSKYL